MLLPSFLLTIRCLIREKIKMNQKQILPAILATHFRKVDGFSLPLAGYMIFTMYIFIHGSKCFQYMLKASVNEPLLLA